MKASATSPRYIALIAAISVAVLVVGMLAKPKKQESQPVISEGEELRLRKLVQKKALDDMAGYLSEAAAGVLPCVVRLKVPDSSGVVWNDAGVVITAAASGQFPPLVDLMAPGGTTLRARTTAAAVGFPVAVIQAPGQSRLRPVKKINPSLIRPGQWLVAVWRQSSGEAAFAPGLLIGVSPSTCGEFRFLEVQSNIPQTSTMAGGGVFDLDGNMVALMIRCGGQPAAMASNDVEAALRQYSDA